MSSATRNQLIAYVASAASSLFFCSKGIFVKSAYEHGADTITVLALRMAMSFPFFLLCAWITSRKAAPLTRQQWNKLILLGFIGYYLSAIINFHGLKYISVGLERIVLFTYPSLVLLGGWLFLRRTIPHRTIMAMLISYVGIVISFMGEAEGLGSTSETLLGVGLVLLSALTYAGFVVISGDLTKEMGALRFTSLVACFSCFFVFLHHGIQHSPGDLLQVSTPLVRDGAILAVFGTLVPFFLMGIGIQRAGSEKFAIIGSIGPAGTLVLAWLILGEIPKATQLSGFVLSLAGGVMVSLSKAKPG